MTRAGAASAATSTAHRIAAARLHGQFLVGAPPHRNPEDVVRALVAVQSQDYPGGKWAIATRASGLTDASIDAAFDRGDIVRTHVLRPTWHFVAPEDLRWLLALTGPRIAVAMSSYNRKMGLDAAVFQKSRRIIEKAIARRGHLTRGELKLELEKRGIETTGTQLAHLVMQAELDGVICSGSRDGSSPTYALVDQRIVNSRTLTRDESLAELAVRYFASRSPATVHDFAWWSGLTMGDARRAIDIAGSALQSLTFDGIPYVVSAGFDLPKRLPRTAHLLPNYDEYFIGFRDRSAIGQRLRSHSLVTGGNALIGHVIVIDGQLVGGWRRRAAGGRTVIDMELLANLAPAERKRLAAAVDSFADFTATAVDVSGAPISR